MKSLRNLAVLVVCGCLSWGAPARADVVTDWNAIAAQAIFSATPPRGGGSSFLDFAMVHLAMHDAIQAFEGRYEPYGAAIPNAEGSAVAAAAAAAHGVLVNRFPSQAGSLDAALQNYLAALGLVGDAGQVVGEEAAAEIVALRTGDGSWPSNPEIFSGGTEPGEWRPTPPAFAAMQVPWLGSVTPFALKSADQLRPPPPPQLSSGKYARDYEEVQALGRATGSSRTQEQTDLALFYSVNLIAQGQQTLRGVAVSIDDIGDTGRLFALANMAAADAAIAAWNAKREFAFWRPITAIQEGENDGNPKTVGEPTWAPFLTTPAYPEYTSGANNFTSAFMRTLALLLGNRTAFTVTSGPPINQTKTYERFSDMARDMVDVRIYQGLHFRTADEVARIQGKRSADWAFSHFLRPCRPHSVRHRR